MSDLLFIFKVRLAAGNFSVFPWYAAIMGGGSDDQTALLMPPCIVRRAFQYQLFVVATRKRNVNLELSRKKGIFAR